MAPPPLPPTVAAAAQAAEGVHTSTRLPALTCTKPPRFCVRCGPGSGSRPSMASTTTSQSTRTRHQKTPNWFYGSCSHNHQQHTSSKTDKNLSLPGIHPGAISNPLNHLTEDVKLQKVQEWLRRSSMPGCGTTVAQNLAAEELLAFTEPKVASRHRLTHKSSKHTAAQKHFRQSADPFQHPYVVPLHNKDFLPGSMVPLAMDSERFDPKRHSKWHGRHQAFTKAQTPQQPLRVGVGPIGRPHSPEMPLIQKQKHRFGADQIYSHHSPERTSSCQEFQVQQQRRDELQARVKTLLMQ